VLPPIDRCGLDPPRPRALARADDREFGILKRVVRIRNDVMHFDPDGISPEELHTLREFARFLGDLQNRLP
jgi:hypothetical protein